MFKLPSTATAPFCPSEVQGSVEIPTTASWLQKLLRFIGPGLLVSVGYMDPGNWATDIEAGSKYGYALLSVVLFSSLSAIVLQCLSLKLGIVAERDLAKLCRERYPKKINHMLWILAELAIVATDLAEVLGSALAFHLLLHVSLLVGVALTALDTFIVLGLQGKGFRRVEAIILGLVATIGICYGVELYLVSPEWSSVWEGFFSVTKPFSTQESLYVAIGILGATVMPHNLYLHSAIVQTRKIAPTPEAKSESLRFMNIDTIVSLALAFLVNAAILILAATAFFAKGHKVTEIDNAYHLLEPLVGGSVASVLFGIALLAAGQSSTFTGTIAAQILMEGFLDIKMPCWKRRLITRGMSLVPAFLGIFLLGSGSIGKLLVFSQVVLSLQLPFAIFPLIHFTSDTTLMGKFRNGIATQAVAWLLFLMISCANLWLLVQVL